MTERKPREQFLQEVAELQQRKALMKKDKDNQFLGYLKDKAQCSKSEQIRRRLK